MVDTCCSGGTSRGTANAAALARPGRYRQVADNLHVKGVWVGQGTQRRRFIVVRNPGEAAPPPPANAISTASAPNWPPSPPQRGDARLAAEGELLAHPALKRYLHRKKTHLTINTRAVKAEERLDGKFLLPCTDDALLRHNEEVVGPAGVGLSLNDQGPSSDTAAISSLSLSAQPWSAAKRSRRPAHWRLADKHAS